VADLLPGLPGAQLPDAQLPDAQLPNAQLAHAGLLDETAVPCPRLSLLLRHAAIPCARRHQRGR
jgi:hypothetical protein